MEDIGEYRQIDEPTLWSLFSAMQKRRPDQVHTPDVEPFDFTHPHRFTPRQRRALSDFSELLARNLSSAIGTTLRGPFRSQISTLTEEYTEQKEQKEEKTEPSYYINLTIDGEVMGFLEFPRPTALQLVTKLLGGMDDAELELNRHLSGLESDLLLDVCERIAEAISTSSQESYGPAIGISRQTYRDLPELATDEKIIECVRIGVQRLRKVDETDLPFFVVLLTDVVEPIAGFIRPPKMSDEQAAQEMDAHVKEVPMPLRVRLDTADVSLRDIACLEPDDVILLQTQVNQPVDVIVSGKVVMRGRPVLDHGYKALQISKLIEP